MLSKQTPRLLARTAPCAIVLATALSFPAAAQTTGGGGSTGTGTTTSETRRDNSGFDWGWLGLLGLAGLLGLRKGPDAQHRVDTTRTVGPR